MCEAFSGTRFGDVMGGMGYYAARLGIDVEREDRTRG